FFFLLFSICNSQYAEIRYVSHQGNNTPPYLTWETAADSIMSAINISSFGDTIYVANGVYEEQVVMIPGLSLIGTGMDSCIVDTRDSANTTSFRSVLINNDCILKGFQILVANSPELGGGIGGSGDNTLITQNRITEAKYGIYTGLNPYIYNNIIDHISSGIFTFNSNSVVRNNSIYTDPDSYAAIVAAIRIEAFDYTYKPIIDSNYIYSNQRSYGIEKSFGASPIISNNFIFLDYGGAMSLSYSDTVKVFNNLILGNGTGIHNQGVQYLQVFNNYIGSEVGSGVVAGPENIIKNNIITNASIGVEKWYNQGPPQVEYNDFWNNDINFSGFTNTDSTNIYEFPMVVNDDSSKGDLDFHLQMFSPLIDAGDPDILDKDGSRSDIGLYGGPFGQSYNYQDLPPRAPVNFTASLDTNYILLAWNRNTETDFSHYNLFRDTTENFETDSTTFVTSIEDTFYIHIIPGGIDNLYFKLTAVDSQGNESEPSEELHVQLTAVENKEPLRISNYRLYQNYPNPFNPTTRIGYRLKESGYVKLYVYDIKGELVETLVNQWEEKGYHEVKFGGEVRSQEVEISEHLASGIYIYQIMVRNEQNIPVFSDIKKMILLK
ncbi:MAG: hypothetical protein OQK82_09245, partial [Candidatus Pacearchaeota archaeon]|nr:hypothetical protein [Candidatus Pacearchaeota archaeon]